MSVRRHPTIPLLLLLLGVLLSIAVRPCLMAFESPAGSADGVGLHLAHPVHHGHDGHGSNPGAGYREPSALDLPIRADNCYSSGCASLEARDLTTPQRMLLELLLKLPLLPALLWLLPLLLLWGPGRSLPPPPHLPCRPPPPLRFRVLLI